MNNTFCQKLYNVNTIKDDNTLISWIEEKAKAKEYQLKYILAHADDGIIWGRFDLTTGKLITAHESFPQFPELRLITLQQCRIFGEQSEILIWKTDEGLKARLAQDSSEYESFPEEQILWGTHKEDEKNDFTLLADGSQGLKHAIPITSTTIKTSENKERLVRPVRLVVHHYFKYDHDKENGTGVARVFLSRLVDFKVV